MPSNYIQVNDNVFLSSPPFNRSILPSDLWVFDFYSIQLDAVLVGRVERYFVLIANLEYLGVLVISMK
jgi:hypothetical protein